MKKVVATRARLFRQREILAVGDGKIDLDWIELRDRRQNGLGAHEIPDLRRSLARHPGNQRANLGKPKIQVRRCNRGLCGLYGSFRLRFLLDFVVQLALAIACASASGVSRFTLICARASCACAWPN